MNDNNMNATPPTITTAKATMGDHDIIISNNESLLEKTSIPQHISDPTFHQISKRPLRVPALKDLYSIRPSRWKQIQQKVMKYYNPTNTTMKVCHVGSIWWIEYGTCEFFESLKINERIFLNSSKNVLIFDISLHVWKEKW